MLILLFMIKYNNVLYDIDKNYVILKDGLVLLNQNIQKVENDCNLFVFDKHKFENFLITYCIT